MQKNQNDFKNEIEKIEYKPIGIFECSKLNPYDTPRQGTANAGESIGIIQLFPGNNFEQALTGLEGFSHLWIIYQFHHNTNWNPMVMPPRGSETKQGLFATRAPYRPNNIGISAVKIEKVEGLKIFVRSHDLLNETPILDIKPYLPYSDSFPDAKIGWLENIKKEKYAISFSEMAGTQIQFLYKKGVTELQSFLIQQLEYDPLNTKKKRVKLGESNHTIAYRTWRAGFSIDTNLKKISVFSIFSGYSDLDLDSTLPDYKDLYHDKNLHREFKTFLGNQGFK